MATTTSRALLIVFLLCFFADIIAAQHIHDDHEIEDHDEIEHHNEREVIWRALGITIFAGFAAFLGGFAMFCVKRDQISVMSGALAFSAGVTIHLSLVSLIPESFELLSHSGERSDALTHLYVLLCVICGAFIGLAMEVLFTHLGVDPHHHHNDHDVPSSTTITDKRTDDDAEAAKSTKAEVELHSAEVEPVEAAPLKPPRNGANHKSDKTHAVATETGTELNLSQTSYAVAFALILHHFPEGIATFVSLYHDLHFGLLVAFALALHDIPSGICISVPLYCATGSKVKPFCLCAVAAAVYPIGALVGWLIIETASEMFVDTFIGILVGITGGIMLYISFIELLPTATISANNCTYKLKQDGNPKNILNISHGLLFAGLLVMSISNIFMMAVGGHAH